jgi:hypothetical protein
MNPLSEVCPDPKKVLALEPEKLSAHVLVCLHDLSDEHMERKAIAKTLCSNYHESFHESVAHAVEAALDWLLAQCLLGATPYDQNLIFLTQHGKKAAADYEATHPVEIA